MPKVTARRSAESNKKETRTQQPRTALVLSAGGMFGSYQAGAWAELASFWQPDIVVGASVGSLNGYLIASGCPPADIEQRWLTLNSRIRWRLPGSPLDGVLDDSDLSALLRQVCGQSQPRVPFGIVATRLSSLTPQLFTGPELTWEHLGASCAVPLVLRSHRLDGALYVDGGLLDPLPLWAAAAMGATHIVAVNVMQHRPLAVRAVVKALNAVSPFRPSLPPQVKVLRISPSTALGPAVHSVFWERDRAARWIELGRQDTRKVKHLVVECFEHQ